MKLLEVLGEIWDGAGLLAIARVWDFAERTCPLRFPPGVYRHRSLEEADVLRERWEAANFALFQERRRAPKG